MCVFQFLPLQHSGKDTQTLVLFRNDLLAWLKSHDFLIFVLECLYIYFCTGTSLFSYPNIDNNISSVGIFTWWIHPVPSYEKNVMLLSSRFSIEWSQIYWNYVIIAFQIKQKDNPTVMMFLSKWIIFTN